MRTTDLITPAEMAAFATSGPIAWHQCPVCGQLHKTEAEAVVCSGENEPPIYRPGDFVALGTGYTWTDGEPDWLYDDAGRPSHGDKTLRFWYVVTAVTQKAERRVSPQRNSQAHLLAYHLQTLGIRNGDPEGKGGWTTVSGSHMTPVRPDRKPPATVIDRAKAMIGRRFDQLI